MVTASVSDRDYNELHLGDPVRFRVSGTDRDYSGRIVKLGSTTTFAIPSDPGSHQRWPSWYRSSLPASKMAAPLVEQAKSHSMTQAAASLHG
jgi:hypothetical protein